MSGHAKMTPGSAMTRSQLENANWTAMGEEVCFYSCYAMTKTPYLFPQLKVSEIVCIMYQITLTKLYRDLHLHP